MVSRRKRCHRRRTQRGGSCGLPQRGGSCGLPLPQRGGSCGLPQRGGSCGLPQRGGGGSCGLPQRGGGWAFDGSTFASANGVPLGVNTVTNDCAVPLRVPPVQLGGGCGCNRTQQGGGTTGGYSVNVGSNELGKMATYVPGSCSQQGGEYPVIPVHTASYSLTDPVTLDSGARYMGVTAGHKGGSRRRRRRKSRRTRR